MAGKSCCGGGGLVPRIDPQDCNALSTGAAGLLVPETEIVGIAPGGNVSTERSVDVDVTPPVDGACPEVWTIGARLTPVYGRTDSVSDLDLLGTDRVYQPVPGAQVQLPESGTYEVTYAAAGEINLLGPAGQGAQIFARLVNAASGAIYPRSDGLVTGVSHTTSNSSATFGTATKSVFLTVTGPTTVRLEAALFTNNGTPTSYTGIFGNWTDVWFKKVAD